MGAPTFLEGLSFRLSKRLLNGAPAANSQGKDSRSHELKVLSLLVADGNQFSFDFGTAKQGKPDDARVRCTLGDSRIDFFLLIDEEEVDDTVSCSLYGFAFHKTRKGEDPSFPGNWKHLRSELERALVRLGADTVIWRSAAEADLHLLEHHPNIP